MDYAFTILCSVLSKKEIESSLPTRITLTLIAMWIRASRGAGVPVSPLVPHCFGILAVFAWGSFLNGKRESSLVRNLKRVRVV